MEALKYPLTVLQSWRFVISPPLSGEANMRHDAELLDGVERGTLPPTVRFFRFKEPTVSYGRLQKRADVAPLSPKRSALVQRPTGGGIVFHDQDLCLSLCWRRTDMPMPGSSKDVYRWIHSEIKNCLGDDLTLACCADTCTEGEPFAVRECFTAPVGYDLLSGTTKVVGGALRCTRGATLYQGSIQMPLSSSQEARLLTTFQNLLHSECVRVIA